MPATTAGTLLPPLAPGALPGTAARVSAWAWVWPTLFIAHFFLPYIAGTRYRVEVFTLLLGLLFPLARARTTANENDLVLFTGLCGFWSLLRLGLQPSPDGTATTAIQWINLNFPLLATCLYLCLRNGLLLHRRVLIKAVLAAGMFNNLVALAQCYLPDLPYHSMIYNGYGGTISADYDDVLTKYTTTAMSNAEFLAKMGGRYTGMLVSSHMLSVFNVWLIGTSYALFRDPHSTTVDQFVAATSVILALGGGVLSGGKMFYLGVAVLFIILLVLRRQFTLVAWGGIAAAAVLCLAPLFIREDAATLFAIRRVLSGDLNEIIGTRFNADGYLTETIERFSTDRKLLMYGTGADLGNLIVADSLFLLPLATGGVPMLVLYLIPFLWLLLQLWRRSGENEYLAVMFSLHASFLLSGVGVPVYQMGRIAPLLWVVTLPFLFAPPEMKARPPMPKSRPSPTPLPPRPQPRPLSALSQRIPSP